MSHNDIHEIDTSDFYSYEHLLSHDERELLHAVRRFMTTDVAPVLLENQALAIGNVRGGACVRHRRVVRVEIALGVELRVCFALGRSICLRLQQPLPLGRSL